MYDYVQVTANTSALTGRPFALEPNSSIVFDSCRNASLHSAGTRASPRATARRTRIFHYDATPSTRRARLCERESAGVAGHLTGAFARRTCARSSASACTCATTRHTWRVTGQPQRHRHASECSVEPDAQLALEVAAFLRPTRCLAATSRTLLEDIAKQITKSRATTAEHM